MSNSSASVVIGGFTIKAVIDDTFTGASFVISRNGVQGFAFGKDDIVRVAIDVQARSAGGNDQAVIVWVNNGGPAQLEQQAQANSGSAPVSSAALVQQEQTARSNGSNTQNPLPAAQSVNSTGTVDAVSVAVPTNAQASTPTTPTASSSNVPPTIPGGSGTSLNSAANNTGSAPVAALPVRSSTALLNNNADNQAVVSYVYRAVQVVSSFSKGRFTQRIEGAQIFFDTQNGIIADGRAESQPLDPQALLRRPVQSPNPGLLDGTQFDIGDAGILPRLDINPSVIGTAGVSGATSGDQSVSIPTISSLIDSVKVEVTLTNGQVREVTNESQVNELLAAGSIDFRQASTAIAALTAKQAAQSPRTGSSYQTVKEY
jgi:hypothetical protein